ncbi:MAG: Ig-like domain-containing protein [Thermodesulfobacteriota bacterium]|nr:Ig-like domain-containing protein [Thermodesulfobacteriota bacterium]
MGKIPRKIKAILGNQERALFTEGKPIYSGVFYAPSEEGRYHLDIEARDSENNLSTFDSVATIEVDNTPPNVTIYFQDELFSPNGDRIKDTVIFFPYLKDPDTIESWELLVENSNNEVIRSVEGRESLPRAVVWRGEDDFNSPMGDGSYYFSLRVRDQASNETKTPQKQLILDKTRPHAQITVDTWDEKGFQFNLDCGDINGIDQWQLSILNPERRTIHSFEGNGKIPSTLQWETLPSSHTDTLYSFKVKDMAGNTLITSPRSVIGSLVPKEVSSSKKDEKKEWNYDF